MRHDVRDYASLHAVTEAGKFSPIYLLSAMACTFSLREPDYQIALPHRFMQKVYYHSTLRRAIQNLRGSRMIDAVRAGR